jgi:hypothetical protein
VDDRISNPIQSIIQTYGTWTLNMGFNFNRFANFLTKQMLDNATRSSKTGILLAFYDINDFLFGKF